MADVSTKSNSSANKLSEEERSPSIASIASKDSSNVVKYLHPGDPASDMESTSEAPTDQSIAGSPSRQVGSSVTTGKTGKDDKSTATTSGPDSDVGSVDDLPIDDEDEHSSSDKAAAEDVSSKVTAGASYIGSFFSSAWSKTAKTANEATVGSTAFFSSAFQKVGGTSAKTSPKEEEAKPVCANDKDQVVALQQQQQPDDQPEATATTTTEASIVSSSSSFFSSAWNKMGEITKTVSGSVPSKAEGEPEVPVAEDHEAAAEDHHDEKQDKGSFFSSLSTIVTKVASDATHVIKDKVGSSVATTMIQEFNREQEEFIKSKGHDHENGNAPWVGYQDEAGMKEKILSLSEDKRTFIRAPPSGVTFEFEYATVAPVALAILAEDPKLEKMRYELVPKVVKEDEFWRNYFYRLNLIKQSFDLKDLESGNDVSKKVKEDQSGSTKSEKKFTPLQDEEEHSNVNTTDPDDEFISDAFQASSKDLDEVNENMKRLGVKNTEEEWEAELEGELNEFEVVSSKEGSPQNAEWENEIQNMLDAEESGK